MASSKDPLVSRPVSGSFSRMSSTSRSHSNSLSLAATNGNHRVHRRKSVNASASSTAQAAIAAALRENGDPAGIPLPTHRRSIGTKKSAESHSMSARPSMHSYFGAGSTAPSIEHDTFEDMSMDEDEETSTKNRNRRASEGSHLIKGSKKNELRCDTCGKGYKHSSCLTKHMWEHDPAWAVTSKLLISKHQQVQLLEAASVLCNMNAESTDLSDTEIPHIGVESSEVDSSASPAYSGGSDQDDISSVETTPPPMGDDYSISDLKRFSASSNGLSRSYRSVGSSSFAESVLSPGLFPQRLSGVDFRPTTSGTDDGSLAAATAGLNFGGTPKTRPSSGRDIPPVPPLPEQYASYSKSANLNMNNPFSLHPPSLTQQLSDERTYKPEREERHDSRTSQLDQEGMFILDP